MLFHGTARENPYYGLNGQHDAGYQGRDCVVRDDEEHRREVEKGHVYASGQISGSVLNLYIPFDSGLNFKIYVPFRPRVVLELYVAHAEGYGEPNVCGPGEIRKGDKQHCGAGDVAQIP